MCGRMPFVLMKRRVGLGVHCKKKLQPCNKINTGTEHVNCTDQKVCNETVSNGMSCAAAADDDLRVTCPNCSQVSCYDCRKQVCIHSCFQDVDQPEMKMLPCTHWIEGEEAQLQAFDSPELQNVYQKLNCNLLSWPSSA